MWTYQRHVPYMKQGSVLPKFGGVTGPISLHKLGCLLITAYMQVNMKPLDLVHAALSALVTPIIYSLIG